ncbi:vWA domain-containing protein [Actinoplanes sp. NPDC051346]|uniref:vWA domain-containing protein n=1 Tax=Actinoplanes sp. NPDC051346 TaxID=3155048 RepID=UPI0034272BDA
MTATRILVRRLAAVMTAGVFGLTPVAWAAPVSAAPGDGQPTPVKVVVLVDESGSLRPEGVAAERDAAKIITSSEFSSSSQLGVVGFASDNGQGQGPVDVVCPMGRADTGPARERYTTCIDRLRIRAAGQDDGTDFPSAVRQGLELLGDADDDVPKIMFLLTDGVLDVSGSDRYGKVPDLRNQAAQKELDALLVEARERRVQVWPLGFGASANRDKLEAFARAGGQQLCNAAARRPEATVVDDPADIVAALQAAFAAARCAALTPETRAPLPSGETTELKAEIPAIATYGSLTVLKRDPRVEVAYRDPAGKTVLKNSASGVSTFEVSGERSTVEVLRIANPVPGTWTIALTSPPQTPDQQVSARVLWQGVVQASVVVDPPQPVPGQPVTASVTIFTATGAVDARSLAGLTVGVQMTGDGIATGVSISVRDDGKDGDRTAGDGQFSGRTTVPTSATGTLSFSGEVSGAGIVTDRRAATTRVQRSDAPLYAAVRLPSGSRVGPGESVRGSVGFVNRSGAAADVRLIPDGLDDGTLATISPATMTVPAGAGTSEQKFTLTFAAGTRRGPAQVTVKVVDAKDAATVYGNAAAAYDVAPPPRTWFWIAVAAGAVFGAALLAWLLTVARRRAAERNVRPLAVVLYRAGQQAQLLNAPDRRAREFRFAVREDGGDLRRLDLAAAGEPAYALARRSSGAYVLRSPDGAETALTAAQRFDLPDGVHQIGVSDAARRAPRQRPAASAATTSATTRDNPSDDDDSLVW